MSDTNRPSKSWIFTCNNWQQKHLDFWENAKGFCNQLVITKEVADTGTPHLQGAVVFNRAFRLSQLNKKVSGHHWKIPDCPADKGFYCIKEDSDVVHNFNNGQQGRRSDLDEVVEECKNGSSLRSIWKSHPKQMIRYSKGVAQLHEVHNPLVVKSKFTLADYPNWTPLDFEESKSHIFEGPTDIGKTNFALAHFENPHWVVHIDDLKRFDAELHDGIVFDDMSFTHLPRQAQIHLLDQDQPRSIHVRYGTAFIPAGTKKIFTCNIGHTPFDLSDAAIRRRVTVTEVDKR